MSDYVRLDLPYAEIDPLALAPQLLDQVLVSDVGSQVVALRITEVEAYLGVGQDPGSHAFRGRTARNATMFGPGGHLYVYRSYGIHWCGNVVAGPAGSAGGVLLRGGEVIVGHDVAAARRTATGVLRAPEELAKGPGRLGAALGLGPELDGTSLLGSGPLTLYRNPGDGSRATSIGIERSTRTGVSGAGAALQHRFFLAADPTVSAHRPVKAR